VLVGVAYTLKNLRLVLLLLMPAVALHRGSAPASVVPSCVDHELPIVLLRLHPCVEVWASANSRDYVRIFGRARY